MGVRQTAQPVGVAVAALALPPFGAQFGLHGALLFPAALVRGQRDAVVVFVGDPPRPAAAAKAPTPRRPTAATSR